MAAPFFDDVRQLRERIARLEDENVYLKHELRGNPGRFFRGVALSRTQARLVAALRFDQWISKDRLLAAIGRPINEGTLCAHIRLLRVKLVPVRVDILCQYATGYMLFDRDAVARAGDGAAAGEAPNGHPAA